MALKKPIKVPSGPGNPGPATEELFAVMAAFEGFDLAGFDAWLASMKQCGAKDELSERRRLAKEAIRCGEVNRDALLRHLEWMWLRWKYIRRHEYIVPLAKIGKALDAGRRRKRRTDVNAWISKKLEADPAAKSPELWRQAPGWITDQIGERRFASRVTDVRKTRK